MTTLYKNLLFTVLGIAFVWQPVRSEEIWWPGEDYPPANRSSAPEWLTAKKK